MRRILIAALGLVVLMNTSVLAQVAGDNVNVLPVVEKQDDSDNTWWRVGDGYLQRQVEPTIAASTVNPDHLLAFFNDYRAVDTVAGDVGLGETEVAATALAAAKTLMRLVMGPMIPDVVLPRPMFAAAEAWVGGSRSYDGGNTWSGFFLPGATWDVDEFGDPNPLSAAQPIYGLEAATDPVLAPGPCGTFYLVFVAFTRNDQSKMVVAKYRDSNDLEGGDTISFEGMTVLETGNNAEHGYFLDKPDIEVDPFRLGAAAKAKPGSEEPIDPCGHRVYASYTTFNGLTKDGKIQTKINFAVSEDGGETYNLTKIQQPYNQNQGTVVRVDPRPGTPTTTGGGTLYLFWRHFFDPDAIVWTKSTDYGVRWSKVGELTGDPPLVPYDQPTISTAVAPTPSSPTALNDGFPELAFRSNGFPAAVVAPYFDETDDLWKSTVFVAWQERVDVDTRRPAVGGSSRIVMMRSRDGGLTWSGINPEDGSQDPADRQAIDTFLRDEPFDPAILMPPGAPEPVTREAGPQVQPKLTFAPGNPGQVMLAFYESRGRIGNYGSADPSAPEYIESNPAFDQYTPYITGYDRVMDFRTTLLDPADGHRISSGQISRYPIKAGADLLDGQDYTDVAPVNPPCSPDDGPGLDPCVRQVNRVNAPTSALGSSPFIGDYPDAVPFVQFVADGGSWRWAIEPGDVPSRGFHSIWTDNRHIVPPDQLPPEQPVAKDLPAGVNEWDLYQFYGPPGIGGACLNSRSRNTDVLFSRVDTETVVSAPTTFKQLDAPRSFPFSVSNKTGEYRTFHIEITSAGQYASLSPIDPEQDDYSVEVFPYSGSALTVYVTPPAGDPEPTRTVGPITVEVRLAATKTRANDDPVPCESDCLVGTIIFNGDPDSQPVQNLDPNEDEDFGPTIGDAFVINWDFDNAFVINQDPENAFLDNAFVINEGEENAFVINDGAENAFVINAFVINAFVINTPIYEVTDTVWEMEPGTSNTSATFVPWVAIDNAKELQGKYAFQLLVDKTSNYGAAGLSENTGACEAYNVSQQQILSNVVQDPGDPNAFVINDSIENAFVINNQVDNAFVINSTFALAPAESPAKSLAKAATMDDSSTKAPPPPSKVRVTLRAFRLVAYDDLPDDPFTGEKIQFNPELHPPSVAVFHQGCNPEVDEECVARNGADLIIADTIDTTPLTVAPCGTVDFPAFTLSNVGNAAAIPRSGTLHHGIFLSDDPYLDLGVDRLLTPNPDDILSTINPLAGQFDPDRDPAVPYEESFGPTQVTLPPDVTGGDYFLILYVDYPREASEYDETNNTVAIPLTVEVGANFEGLQSPLLYDQVHFANAGSAVPLVWRYVDGDGNPVDSAEPVPVIHIEGWSGQLCGEHGDGDPDTVLEDPGSSGQRYDDLLLQWQFNWQTKDGGDPLPAGCYEITISTIPNCEGTAAGPFLVYLD